MKLIDFIGINIKGIKEEIITLKNEQADQQTKLQQKMLNKAEITETVSKVLDLEKRVSYCEGALGVYQHLEEVIKQTLEKEEDK